MTTERVRAQFATDKSMEIQLRTDGSLTQEATKDLIAPVIAAEETLGPIIGSVADLKVDEALDHSDVVRGRALSGASESAWVQTTNTGSDVERRLPLGYTPDGRLDAYARERWLADVHHAVEVADHPEWAYARIMPDGTLLYGIRWNRDFVVNGRVVSSDAESNAGAEFVLVGGRVRRVRADVSRWAGWGSSSMEALASRLAPYAVAAGAEFFAGGKGGERAAHTAARMGAIPALLTVAGGSIPASGPVVVTASNMPASSSLRAFSGSLGGVVGVLSSTATQLTFTRASPGVAVAVPAGAPFVSSEGEAWRAGLNVLWVGKNSFGVAGADVEVIDTTRIMAEFLTPAHPRFLVLTHFKDTGTLEGSLEAQQIDAANAAYRDAYGPVCVDVAEYVSSSRIWVDTGVTPTSADLEQQAVGNLPASLANDPQHLNTAGMDAVGRFVRAHLETLEWV